MEVELQKEKNNHSSCSPSHGADPLQSKEERQGAADADETTLKGKPPLLVKIRKLESHAFAKKRDVS